MIAIGPTFVKPGIWRSNPPYVVVQSDGSVYGSFDTEAEALKGAQQAANQTGYAAHVFTSGSGPMPTTTEVQPDPGFANDAIGRPSGPTVQDARRRLGASFTPVKDERGITVSAGPYSRTAAALMRGGPGAALMAVGAVPMKLSTKFFVAAGILAGAAFLWSKFR